MTSPTLLILPQDAMPPVGPPATIFFPPYGGQASGLERSGWWLLAALSQFIQDNSLRLSGAIWVAASSFKTALVIRR